MENLIGKTIEIEGCIYKVMKHFASKRDIEICQAYFCPNMTAHTNQWNRLMSATPESNMYQANCIKGNGVGCFVYEEEITSGKMINGIKEGNKWIIDKESKIE